MKSRILFILLFTVFYFGNGFSQTLVTNWSQSFNSENQTTLCCFKGIDIDRDQSGNTVMAGTYNGVVDIGGWYSNYYLPTEGNGFITMYNNWGNRIWSAAVSKNIFHSYAQFDSNNDLICVFNYYSNNSEVDLYLEQDTVSMSIPDSLVNEGILLLKLSNSGTYLWHKFIGKYEDQFLVNAPVSGLVSSFDLEIDQNDNINIIGNVTGEVELDNDFTTAEIFTTSFQGMVLTYSSNGVYIGHDLMHGNMSTSINTVTNISKNSNYTVLTGYFEGTIDFDPGLNTDSISSQNGENLYLSLFDSNGDYLWTKTIDIQLGVSPGGWHPKVHLSNDDEIYWGGYFRNTIDLDPNSGSLLATSNGWEDMFLSKFNVQGNLMWSKTYGGFQSDQITSISSVNSDQILVSGVFRGVVDFDTNNLAAPLTTKGETDGFILDIDSSGTTNGVYQFGFSTFESVSKVLVDQNSISVVGSFHDSLNLDFTGNESYAVNPYFDFSNNPTFNQGVYLANYSFGFLGLNDDLLNDKLSLFPNPTNNQIAINGIQGAANLKIFNTQGQLLKEIQNFSDGSIDLSLFENGIYLIQLELDGQMIVKKIVKQ